MEQNRKHDWDKCLSTIYRCTICKKFDVINIIEEQTTPAEIVEQKKKMQDRTDCSGEAYK